MLVNDINRYADRIQAVQVSLKLGSHVAHFGNKCSDLVVVTITLQYQDFVAQVFSGLLKFCHVDTVTAAVCLRVRCASRSAGFAPSTWWSPMKERPVGSSK